MERGVADTTRDIRRVEDFSEQRELKPVTQCGGGRAGSLQRDGQRAVRTGLAWRAGSALSDAAAGFTSHFELFCSM